MSANGQDRRPSKSGDDVETKWFEQTMKQLEDLHSKLEMKERDLTSPKKKKKKGAKKNEGSPKKKMMRSGSKRKSLSSSNLPAGSPHNVVAALKEVGRSSTSQSLKDAIALLSAELSGLEKSEQEKKQQEDEKVNFSVKITQPKRPSSTSTLHSNTSEESLNKKKRVRRKKSLEEKREEILAQKASVRAQQRKMVKVQRKHKQIAAVEQKLMEKRQLKLELEQLKLQAEKHGELGKSQRRGSTSSSSTAPDDSERKRSVRKKEPLLSEQETSKWKAKQKAWQENWELLEGENHKETKPPTLNTPAPVISIKKDEEEKVKKQVVVPRPPSSPKLPDRSNMMMSMPKQLKEDGKVKVEATAKTSFSPKAPPTPKVPILSKPKLEAAKPKDEQEHDYFCDEFENEDEEQEEKSSPLKSPLVKQEPPFQKHDDEQDMFAPRWAKLGDLVTLAQVKSLLKLLLENIDGVNGRKSLVRIMKRLTPKRPAFAAFLVKNDLTKEKIENVYSQFIKQQKDQTDFSLKYDAFCSVLGLERDAKETRGVFNACDQTESGFVDIRMFLIALTTIASGSEVVDTIEFAFKMFDRKNMKKIPKVDLVTILRAYYITGSILRVLSEEEKQQFVLPESETKLTSHQSVPYLPSEQHQGKMLLAPKSVPDLLVVETNICSPTGVEEHVVIVVSPKSSKSPEPAQEEEKQGPLLRSPQSIGGHSHGKERGLVVSVSPTSAHSGNQEEEAYSPLKSETRDASPERTSPKSLGSSPNDKSPKIRGSPKQSSPKSLGSSPKSRGSSPKGTSPKSRGSSPKGTSPKSRGSPKGISPKSRGSPKSIVGSPKINHNSPKKRQNSPKSSHDSPKSHDSTVIMALGSPQSSPGMGYFGSRSPVEVCSPKSLPGSLSLVARKEPEDGFVEEDKKRNGKRSTPPVERDNSLKNLYSKLHEQIAGLGSIDLNTLSHKLSCLREFDDCIEEEIQHPFTPKRDIYTTASGLETAELIRESERKNFEEKLMLIRESVSPCSRNQVDEAMTYGSSDLERYSRLIARDMNTLNAYFGSFYSAPLWTDAMEQEYQSMLSTRPKTMECVPTEPLLSPSESQKRPDSSSGVTVTYGAPQFGSPKSAQSKTLPLSPKSQAGSPVPLASPKVPEIRSPARSPKSASPEPASPQPKQRILYSPRMAMNHDKADDLKFKQNPPGEIFTGVSPISSPPSQSARSRKGSPSRKTSPKSKSKRSPKTTTVVRSPFSGRSNKSPVQPQQPPESSTTTRKKTLWTTTKKK